MTNLYPTFDVPVIVENKNITENKTKQSISFDFDTGDFKLDNSGRIVTAQPYDSWVEWCLKTVYTQRLVHMAYSDQAGVEMEEAFNQNTRNEQESYMERTITEALLADPYRRTKRIYNFLFDWKVDGVNVSFMVSGIWDNDAQITAKLNK